jgi:cysteine synthase A
MIKMAEEQGLLTPHSGDAVYEGTVGSTGISLATLCRARGYLAHICMPNDQAIEKSDLLLKLGAVVERVPPAPIVDQMHFVNRARKLAAEHTADPNVRGRGYFADQFENEANWQAHYEGTGPEILRQCGGRLDAFVAGAGTGGTISGVARYLKPKFPDLKVVLADPQGSGLFNRIKFGVMFDPKEKEGTRRRTQVDTIVEGIGMNRVTANFEAGRELIDDAIKVDDSEAIAMARWLVEKDGLFVGSSTAVNCVAAVKLAQKMDHGSKIVTILCDSGARHLSRFWAKAGPIGGKTDSTLEEVLRGA